MRLPPVDQRSNHATADIIDAAAFQRKSLASQIDYGRSEIDLAVEPGFDGMLIGGRNVGEMIDQQRTDVAGNHLIANR